MTTPDVSVVIATYNRVDSVRRLLAHLAEQTLPASRYEVLVVDDGSAEPVAGRLGDLQVPYALHLLAQPNAGPAAARHRGLARARGALVVILDDDMRVGPDFLAEHLAMHPPGTRRAVLGRLRPEPGARLPLFERCHLALLAKLEEDVARRRIALRGTNLYTGNVSFRRADYLAVGGFDPAFRLSEDAELGVRLELAGVEFRFADGAIAWHASDHTSLATWMRRSAAYGAADSRVAAKHPEHEWVSPWRFLFLMHPISRPALLTSALAPALARPITWLAIRVALLLARLGAERVALAGTTFVYGMQYFGGVHAHAGSPGRAARALLDHARRRRPTSPSRDRPAAARVPSALPPA